MTVPFMVKINKRAYRFSSLRRWKVKRAVDSVRPSQGLASVGRAVPAREPPGTVAMREGLEVVVGVTHRVVRGTIADLEDDDRSIGAIDQMVR